MYNMYKTDNVFTFGLKHKFFHMVPFNIFRKLWADAIHLHMQ